MFGFVTNRTRSRSSRATRIAVVCYGNSKALRTRSKPLMKVCVIRPPTLIEKPGNSCGTRVLLSTREGCNCIRPAAPNRFVSETRALHFTVGFLWQIPEKYVRVGEKTRPKIPSERYHHGLTRVRYARRLPLSTAHVKASAIRRRLPVE